MGQIRGKQAVRSLRGSIVLYITVFTLAALLLSGKTANLCMIIPAVVYKRAGIRSIMERLRDN